ncbi:MAG: ATP-binding cassette domain-containing protein, partial [Acidimicrobiales bacterium]
MSTTAHLADDRIDVDVRLGRPSITLEVRLSIAAGERVALFGPSGAGKTTLLEVISGSLPPDRGEVTTGSSRLSKPPFASRRWLRAARRARGGPHPAPGLVSLVRQPTTVFPHLSVAANVAYGRADPVLASRLVAALGLSGLEGAMSGSLSGGQRQRVALARALARHFRLLLLDEPVSALDVLTRSKVWPVIDERLGEEQAAAVLVTHDLEEAEGFGDRLVVIDNGRVLADGDPHALVAAPGSRRVAEMVGYGTFLAMGAAGEAGAVASGRGGRDEELALDEDRFLIGEHPNEGVVLGGSVVSCRPAGSRFRVGLLVRAGAPLSVAGK